MAGVKRTKPFMENSNANEDHHHCSSRSHNASGWILFSTAGYAGKSEPAPVEGDEGCNYGFGKRNPQTEGVLFPNMELSGSSEGAAWTRRLGVRGLQRLPIRLNN